MSILLVVNTPPTGLLEKGVEVSRCGTCRTTRGVAEDRLVERARVVTIHDLAEATVRCGRVASS